MKKNRLITALVLLLGITISSCNKDKTDDDMTIYTDAYAITRLVDGTPHSAIGYYVQANRSLQAVSVIPPGNNNPITLESFENSSQTYSYEPVLEDFLSGNVESGNFLFEIESTRGEIFQQTDFLQPATIVVPDIASTTFDNTTLTLTVRWNADTNTDAVVIMLLNEQEQAIYSTPLLSPTMTELNIRSGDSNWTTPAGIGDVLVVRVQSVIFEDDAGASNNFPNFNTIAFGEKTILWE